MQTTQQNTPFLMKRLRGVLREGDITILCDRTGFSRQYVHRLLKAEAMTEAHETIRREAKRLLQEHHQEEKQLIDAL